jgi:hypothetical protein
VCRGYHNARSRSRVTLPPFDSADEAAVWARFSASRRGIASENERRRKRNGTASRYPRNAPPSPSGAEFGSVLGLILDPFPDALADPTSFSPASCSRRDQGAQRARPSKRRGGKWLTTRCECAGPARARSRSGPEQCPVRDACLARRTPDGLIQELNSGL